MKIISRQEALRLGLSKYFTGKPCKHGHISERTVRGACIQCRTEWGKSQEGRKYRRNYMDKYRNLEIHKQSCKKATDNHRERRRQYLFDLKKTLSCVYCGESNPLCLDMDHTDPASKAGTPAQMVMSGTKWDLVLDELKKCQPVCRNCHNIKTIIESGKLKNQDIDQFIPDSMRHLMK